MQASSPTGHDSAGRGSVGALCLDREVATDYLLRPMTQADVLEVERVSAEAFADLERRTHRAGWPEPRARTAAESAQWQERVAHLVAGDPRGSWVAEDRGGILGAAVGMKRDLTWLLAVYVVRPGVQGRGVGRQLLEAAMSYGSGCLRAMVAATDDPSAARRYRLAGLSLHPTMLLRGQVQRAALPVVERVREGSLGDIDLLNSVDRQVRDSAHGRDHELLLRSLRLVVTDRVVGSGYAYIAPEGGPFLLAATGRRAAAELLWESLAASSPEAPVTVARVSAANEWAVDVGMACGLRLGTRGYLALRGMKPPTPYLHSGHFL
jgi:GNAT superfamily N-acetyltransferase